MKYIKNHKLVTYLVSGLVGFGVYVFVALGGGISVSGEQPLGGGNLPDRCVQFTQIASRSTKDLIKAAPGKVFSFSVTSSASNATYFQLYDRSNSTLPGVGLATPSFVIPIPHEIANEQPALVQHEFAAPFGTTASGVFFGISANYSNYSKPANIKATDFSVEICYQ